MNFLFKLEKIIQDRKDNLPDKSYTTSLFKEGTDRILQKVGEESIEYVLASKNTDKEKIISEGSDLMFHFILSLVNQGISLEDIGNELEKRNTKR